MTENNHSPQQKDDRGIHSEDTFEKELEKEIERKLKNLVKKIKIIDKEENILLKGRIIHPVALCNGWINLQINKIIGEKE